MDGTLESKYGPQAENENTVDKSAVRMLKCTYKKKRNVGSPRSKISGD